ncbi:hypothetical protein DSO57_1003467 [Entomophthora muscae]|uniref:Uncharacterized protein n=1 Tax=Entomophthora muscae TaxID=34485 RepID=A0ACC2UUE8_9FUNG|nr:hypothetical protein DSO57_1003467 [Entomophthora muscae]
MVLRIEEEIRIITDQGSCLREIRKLLTNLLKKESPTILVLLVKSATKGALSKPEEPAVTARETAKPGKEPAEPTKYTAKNATPKEGSPQLFAPSQDFKEDPVHQLVAYDLYAIPAHERGRPRKTTANAVEVVSKPYATQVQESCLNENPNFFSEIPSLKGVQLTMLLETIENNFP